MNKERYDTLVAVLLILCVACLGIQFFFPATAPAALLVCILAIGTISLQMRAKPLRHRAQ